MMQHRVWSLGRAVLLLAIAMGWTASSADPSHPAPSWGDVASNIDNGLDQIVRQPDALMRPEDVSPAIQSDMAVQTRTSRFAKPLCEFCNLGVPPITLEHFTSQMAGDIGTSISDWNLALIARTDSLRADGFFGPPEDESTALEAARYFKYHALTAMDFISYLSTQQRVAWESDEKGISPFFSQFANPGIYPVWGLRRVILGGGAFCMDFEVVSGFDAERMLGIRPVHLRAEKLKKDGDTHRAWSLEMETACSGTAHYLFSERYKGRVRQLVVEDDAGRPLKLTVLEDIEGFYVKKWGTHKCGAIVLWRSLLSEGDRPSDSTCIGGAAYFPGLHLRLPGPIPDVDVDDLRSFPGFQPVIAAEYCGRAEFPAWLNVSADGTFQSWDNEGGIPRIVRDWFPDL
jgi:hypothetical protein